MRGNFEVGFFFSVLLGLVIAQQGPHKGPLEVISKVPGEVQAMKLPWLLFWRGYDPFLTMLSLGLELCSQESGGPKGPHSV